MNYNNNVEIADVIGIVNLIHGKPVTKASALRSEAEAPVQMELDADNFLTMNSQVPVAGIYLELVGAIDEIPLLGDGWPHDSFGQEPYPAYAGGRYLGRSLLLRREGQQLEVWWRCDRDFQRPDRGDQPIGSRVQLSEPVPWQHDLPLSVDGGGRIRDDPRILCEWRFGRGIERSARRGGR